MKWNMVFGALVVSVGLCSQSFGFELLDRMLGLNDCGCNSCCTAEASCGCDKGCEPACCAAAAPACGCAAACEPACGCAAPACDSCCASTCCRKKCHSGLFCGLHDRLFGCCHKKRCCDSGCGGCAAACEPACAAPAACGCAAAEPACGCAPACDSCNSCCKKRHCGLLEIFHCHKRCCKPACGCGNGCAAGCDWACGCAAAAGCAVGCAAGCGAPMGDDSSIQSDDAAPMPPAPTADPSASVPSKRRVVAASSKVVRRN